MNRDPKALYQALILEHAARPRNAGPLPEATHEATAHNPLCGDRVTLRLRVVDGVVRDARFEARGCMIALASASLLGEAVREQTIAEALTLARTLQSLVADERPPDDAGPLEPLRGVRDFPARKACATLPWDALAEALATMKR